MTVTKLLALDSNPSFETPFSVGGGSTIFSGQLVGRGTGSPQWKVSRSQVCIIWTKETKELVYPPTLPLPPSSRWTLTNRLISNRGRTSFSLVSTRFCWNRALSSLPHSHLVPGTSHKQEINFPYVTSSRF